MSTARRLAWILPLCVAGCASSPAARPARGTPPARTDVALYTVQSGDSLIRLAARFHVDGGPDALARVNGIDRPDLLRAGRGLLIPVNPPFTDGLPPYRLPASSTRALQLCNDVMVSNDQFSPLAPAEITGCLRAACSSNGGVSVCTCAATDGNDTIIVRRGDAERARWRAVFAADAYDSLTPAWAHLDGDGSRDLVVAWLSTVGSALSLQGWGVAVLGRDLRAPLTFAANEFGNGSLLARDAGPGCDLLGTEWAEHRDAILGPGLYLVARTFRYGDGALRALDEPVLGRRLLDEFAQELTGNAGHSPRGNGVRWFDRGRAEVLPDDPLVGDGSAGGTPRAGVVREAAVDASGPPGRVLRLEIAVDGGATESVVASAAPDAPRLGDAATGAVWPRGYCPADPDALRGQRVRIASYPSASNTRRTVVWIGDAAPPR